MLSFIDFFKNRVSNLILQGAKSCMGDKEFLEKEIARLVCTMKMNMTF